MSYIPYAMAWVAASFAWDRKETIVATVVAFVVFLVLMITVLVMGSKRGWAGGWQFLGVLLSLAAAIGVGKLVRSGMTKTVVKEYAGPLSPETVVMAGLHTSQEAPRTALRSKPRSGPAGGEPSPTEPVSLPPPPSL